MYLRLGSNFPFQTCGLQQACEYSIIAKFKDLSMGFTKISPHVPVFFRPCLSRHLGWPRQFLWLTLLKDNFKHPYGIFTTLQKCPTTKVTRQDFLKITPMNLFHKEDTLVIAKRQRIFCSFFCNLVRLLMYFYHCLMWL